MTDTAEHPLQELDRVVIRFAGDSGDGMQLTGDRFTSVSAVFGNDLSTLPDYPAEIRAPAGTMAGVSAFQVHISDHDVLTPGDDPNVLVAMNPAALRSNVGDVAPGGTLIVNVDSFDERSLAKAGYQTSPLADDSLANYVVYEVPMTSLTLEATKSTGAKPRDAERSKNFFALGLISWMYTRPVDSTLAWIEKRFAAKPAVAESNTLAFKAGYNFGETTEVFANAYEVKPTTFPPGTYTNISGNVALAWGLVAAGHLSKLPVFLASYPITPASDILHELSKHKNFGVRTMQAEDEIAAIGAALGASFGGHLGVTTTSGPGLDLKAETLGLAISLELPLVVIDVQRGGPSTGLPTKTEQADLMLAMYGRHGEAPLPVVAASTPSHCFAAAIEAARIALRYRTPVILLSDGYLATGAEPWRVPSTRDLPDIGVAFATEPNHTAPNHTGPNHAGPNHAGPGGTGPESAPEFLPYLRDTETLARPWAVPGTPGLEHRIGGLEKSDPTGVISYDPANHEHMVKVRAAKVAGIAKDIPLVDVDGEGDADLLVLGWGSTYGAIKAAVQAVRGRGYSAHHAHLTHLNPFPPNLGEVLRRYRRILVPELNSGQLSRLVRAEYLVDAKSLSKVRGLPFRTVEIENAILALLRNEDVEWSLTS